jgi:hypothetical protein
MGIMLSVLLIKIDRWSISILATCSFFLVVGLFQALLVEERELKIKTFYPRWIESLFLVSGMILTYALSVIFGVDAVIASALIGVLAYVFMRDYATAIYCGSFAGMTASVLIEPVMMGLVAAILVIVYGLTKGLLTGFGGKLGTLALISTFSTVILLNRDFLVVTLPQYDPIILVVIAAFGAIIPYVMQHRYRQDPVFASAGPSLLFALVSIPLFSLGAFYSGVFFSASFIGMSDRTRLKNVYWVLLSGLVLGVLYDLMAPLFNGAGGKLGTLALLSVLIVFGFEKVVTRIFGRSKTVARFEA